MKYFLISGTLKSPELDPNIRAQHKEYARRLKDEGKILFSAMKESGMNTVALVKETSLEAVKNFCDNEPFFKSGGVQFEISELNMVYKNSDFFD